MQSSTTQQLQPLPPHPTAQQQLTPLSALLTDKQKYCIRYEGNGSKRWDGKEILVDKDWLESLYDPVSLVDGKAVVLPWSGKKGAYRDWKAVVVGIGE